GRRAAVVAVWCQWMQILVWYPTVLSFGAATIAYIFNPALAENVTFNIVLVLVIFWSVTLLNLRGIRTSSLVATVGLVLGTIVPVLLVILFAAIWLASDQAIAIPEENRGFLPRLEGIRGLALAAGMVTFYSGLEVNAVHGSKVRHPRTTIPFSMIFAATLVLGIYVFGSLGVAFVLPPEEIRESLNVGPMEMFRVFLSKHGLSALSPLLAACLAVGVLGHVSTWVIGPAEAVRKAAENRDLPEILSRTNRNGAPTLILFIQAVVVTAMTLPFMLLKGVSVAFFFLTALSGTVYLIMYMMMFAAGIRLRYSHPHVERHFKVFGGLVGMWIIAGLGIAVCLTALLLSFLPPEKSQIDVGNITMYVSIEIAAFIILVGIGLVLPLPTRRAAAGHDDSETGRPTPREP
ncbi:MAG: amino acid permease, partial [Myxococcota bacterium]